MPLNFITLLFGSNELDASGNKLLTLETLKFIKDTKCFQCWMLEMNHGWWKCVCVSERMVSICTSCLLVWILIETFKNTINSFQTFINFSSTWFLLHQLYLRSGRSFISALLLSGEMKSKYLHAKQPQEKLYEKILWQEVTGGRQPANEKMMEKRWTQISGIFIKCAY